MTDVKYSFIPPIRNALVITPTIGKPSLYGASLSVNNQKTQHKICHLLVVDGLYNLGDVDKNLCINKVGRQFLTLPWNIGKDGGSWYGHRAYAAVAHIIPQLYDYVFLLDEDNGYADGHIETCIELMESQPDLHFCHSLRLVVDGNGEVLRDDCESLGKWPIYLNDKAHLVDTSSYCFRREFFRQVGHIWDFGWGGDRRFFNAMMQAGAKYDCTGKYTLAYTVAGGEGSVTMDFFKEGNRIMKEKYPNGYPWSKE